MTATPALTGANKHNPEGTTMPNLHTTVYLNESPDRHWGITNHQPLPAELRQAASFELEIAEHVLAHELSNAALEVVFEQLNIDEPDQDWALRYRLAGHRSLSVGDVVVVGETAWLCESVGWNRLTTDELCAALTAR
ncbi:hypothetical protein [Mycobacterium camsae]|uniref:hypothetical protein n=1 Tax=Mycobacterium gordonae TaxID=1778 RepID=UPI001F11E013|nr:hypothetical protein [Mycobacterium gordonae]